jgi:hypothetical protein
VYASFIRSYDACQEHILRRRFLSVYFSARAIGYEERGVIPTGSQSGLQTLTATTEIFSAELVFMPLRA